MAIVGSYAIVLDSIYRCAGCVSEDVEGVGWLALRLLGDGAIQYAAGIDRVRLVLEPRPRILVSDALSDAELTLAIAEGIAAWWLSRPGHPVALANYDVAALGAAIAVPVDRLQRASEDESADVSDLAYAFNVPERTVRERLRHMMSGSGTYPRVVLAG